MAVSNVILRLQDLSETDQGWGAGDKPMCEVLLLDHAQTMLRGDPTLKNVLLIDDPAAKFPNLALMKWSAFHHSQGDKVDFYGISPDIIYVSCIFSKSRAQLLGRVKLYAAIYPNAEIHLGGYGFNKRVLPDHIEHIMPDYKLFNVDYSMGFTSRGCIRRCPFCIVPLKEGPMRDHAKIVEFHWPDHDKLILLDNNFLASPRWRENLEYIHDRDLRVNFSQGLDFRLVNDENAAMLAQTSFSTWTFNSSYIHFAFDDVTLEPIIRRSVNTLKEHGIAPSKLIVYFLCGFNSTHEEDMHRLEVLSELGCNPYVMKYNDRDDDPWLNAFDRWVNGFLYRSTPFNEYAYNPEVKS